MTQIWSFISRFNSPEKPCIHPVVRLIVIFGLWHRGRSLIKTIFVITNLVFYNLFLIAVITNLIINFTYYIFMEFIQHSPYYLSVYVLTTMFIQHHQWEQLIYMIIQIERKSLLSSDKESNAIILKYKNYSQFVIYGFYMIFVPMLLFFFSSFWLNNVIIPHMEGSKEPFVSTFYVWLPFDQNVNKFWSAFIQTLFGLTTSIGMWTWNTFLLASSMFFIGQLKSLRLRCVNSVVEDDEEQTMRNIVSCHQQFVDLLRCQKKFNSLMGWVAFPQLLQMSMVCGVCIIKVVLDEDPAVVTKSLTIFIGLNMQWGLFYGIANDVIVHSVNLSYGIFCSRWVGRSARVRRSVLMLGVGMERRVCFTAGPFSEMSLVTLSAIWRATYSIYAVLSQTAPE